MLRGFALCGFALGGAVMMTASVLATEPVSSVGESIDPILKQAAELRVAGKMDESLNLLRACIEKLTPKLSTDSDAGETLANAVEEAKAFSDPSRKQTRLYWGLQETRAAITFKPVLEAPLPAGFPGPGEVGKVIVKEYPAYRAARTSMDNSVNDNGAFGKLFRHITSHDVKMTAPVEMVYKSDDAAVSMAFLYEKPDLGNSGKDGEVEVVDLPAVTVISIGVRGNYSDDRRKQATEKLNAWLEENKSQYQSAGPVRVMGYNSPFVLPMLRFSEVQIPVTKK